MKRNIALLVSAIVAASGMAQITYNNFYSSSNGVAAFGCPADEIDKITVADEGFTVYKTDGTTVLIKDGYNRFGDFVTVSASKLLAELYSYQYYGLPYGTNGMHSSSPYAGKFDALTDCYHLHWSGADVVEKYYGGTLTSNDDALFSYNKEFVWEVVNKANDLISRLEKIDTPEAAGIMAEAKCIIAGRYFDMLMHYGGLPILTEIDYADNYIMGDINVEEGVCEPIYCDVPGVKGIHSRRSVEETVDYMVRLLDEAIPNLVWEPGIVLSAPTERINQGFFSLHLESRRWSKAAAMALKAKILLFAASPLFNDAAPYYSGATEEQKPLVWLGGYDASRWQKALQACEDFFAENNAHAGCYELVQPINKDCDSYRLAYRKGYKDIDSKEVLMSTRVTEQYGTQGSYTWLAWSGVNSSVYRNAYSPTEEYAEMFGWSDGSPFISKSDVFATGICNKLFYTYSSRGRKTASRDPRLYENAVCNGQNELLETNGKSEGSIFEFWRGGYHAGFDVAESSGQIVEANATICPTGYGCMKYVLTGKEYLRKPLHWVMLSLNEMYLMYAEALAAVDVVRSRVGLGSLADCYKTAYGKALEADKDLLIEEILRERACELGLSNNRYYDMVRYKRTDWMTRRLHGLLALRKGELLSDGTYAVNDKPWFGDDKNAGVAEPSKFIYKRFELITNPRMLWGKDKDSDEVRRWLLSPLPQSEIDKNKGLVQNPGW